jgi:membrane-associated phospholipid phosphatase
LPIYAFSLALIDDDDDAKYQFIKSFAATNAAVHILKPIVGEKRPNGHSGSFPSGHTAAAFSGATFIHKRYGFKRAIAPYALAVFTGYSRVQAKKHYTHDVIAGAGIAAAFVWVFTDEKIVVAPLDNGAIVSYKISF